MIRPKELYDPGIPDTFVSSCARIERLPGNCVRMVLTTETANDQLVVSKVVLPIALLAVIHRQVDYALAEGLCAAVEMLM